MIILNNKEFDLFKSSEYKIFEKEFPWFGPETTIRIKLPKERIKESDQEHNRKQGMKIKPNATILPIKESVMTLKGPQIWIYAENFDRHESTGVLMNINPPNIVMDDDMDISFDKVELAFFMWIMKYCGNGPNFNAKQSGAAYIIEKPEEEAIEDISVRKTVSRVEAMIYNDDTEGGLSNKEIEKLCIPFHVKLSDGNRVKGATELRKELIIAIEVRSFQRQGDQVVNTMLGHKMFLNLLKDRSQLQHDTLIARAKELKVLRVKGMKVDAGKNQYWAIQEVSTGNDLKKFAEHFKGQHPVDHDKFLQQELKKDPELIKLISDAVQREEAGVLTD